MPRDNDVATAHKDLNRSGYVLVATEDRALALLNAMEVHGIASEAVPEFSHSRSIPMLCFLSFKRGFITHLAIGKRGRRAATEVRTLNLEQIFELNDWIEHYDIVDRVEVRYKRRVQEKLEEGGALTPRTFNQVLESLWSLSPSLHSFLERYRQTRQIQIAQLPRRTREVLANQKDAVATALKIAGIETEKLQKWKPTTDQVSFLSGLEHVRVREDAVVVADLNQIPGFDVVKRYQFSAVTFANQYTKLTVVLANHLPLEEQLGADLIYYNHRYDSFVAVQYKMMERGGRDGATFRLPNAQLETEISRMNAAIDGLKNAKDPGMQSDFRLTSNPFFLKLCARDIFNPDDESLVKGMYFPLGLWKFLSADETLVGSGGGRQITYENAGRYFDNTEFMRLVTHAWVGTTPGQSALLAPIIRETLDSGRSVILASAAPASPTAPPPPHYMRS